MQFAIENVPPASNRNVNDTNGISHSTE